MSNDKYRKAIFNAQVYANTGAGTYEKAVDMACRDMLRAGLNCVEYSNGARHTLEDYARMAIRTANKRAYLYGEGQKRQEWGISTVTVNSRRGGCPLCTPYIGKIFIDDVYSGGKKTDGEYPLLSDAIKSGLFHPNCKDSTSTYYEGITTLQSVTKEEQAEMKRREKLEAQESYYENQAKKNHRIADHSLDNDNKKIYSHRAEVFEQKAAEIKNELENKPFIKAKSLKEAEQFSKTYSESDSFVIDPKMKLDVVNGFNEAANNVYQRYGRKLKINGISPVKAADSRYEQAAYSPRSGIVSLKNSSISTYQKNAEKNFADGWNASKDKYGTFYHEIGHAVWEDLPREAKSKIYSIYSEEKHKVYQKWMDMGGSSSGISQADVFQKSLSRYAHTSSEEFFSEAFSQIMSGRARPVSRRVNEVLNQHYRLEKSVESGIIYSGARITDLFSKEAEKFAEMYYEEIRHFSTDYKKIAIHLGKSEEDVKKIKSYLFEDKSLFDEDINEFRRFDPDCAIAQSWQRLMIGKDIKPHDKTLIEHELYEMRIKADNPSLSHLDAHEIATRKYDYQTEAGEYYGNLKKNKKRKGLH